MLERTLRIAIVAGIASVFVFSCSFFDSTSKQEGDSAPSLVERTDLPLEHTAPYYGLSKEGYQEKESKKGDSSKPLEIVSFGPGKGQLPMEAVRSAPYVVFNQPMIPLAQLGNPIDRSSLMKISPAVEGRFRWYGSRVFGFQPSSALPLDTTITVTVTTKAQSLEGGKLRTPFSFAFTTPSLEVVEMIFGQAEAYHYDAMQVPPEAAQNITLIFNGYADLKQLKKHLVVKSKKRSFPFKVRPFSQKEESTELTDRFYPQGEVKRKVAADLAARAVLIDLRKSPPEDTPITIELAEKGKPSRILASFATLSPLKFEKEESQAVDFLPFNGKRKAFVEMKFSHPLLGRELSKHITIAPPYQKMLKEITDGWGGRFYLDLEPPAYGIDYSISVSRNLRDVYGRELAEDLSIDMKMPFPSPESFFPVRGTKFLESGFPFRYAAEFYGFDKVLWKMGRLANPLQSFPASELTPYLFPPKDPQNPTMAKVDLNPLLNSQGKGAVGISWQLPNQRVDLSLQVTDIGVTTRLAPNKILVWANSLASGTPKVGAKVEILRADGRVVREARTSQEGLAVLPFKKGAFHKIFWTPRLEDGKPVNAEEEGKYVALARVSVGSDSVVYRLPVDSSEHLHESWRFNVRGLNYGPSMREVDNSRRSNTLLFTDRGVYRPGEEVSVSGYVRDLKENRYVPYVGPFELTTPFDETSIKKRTTKSGKFSATFKIPEGTSPDLYDLLFSTRGKKREIVSYFRVAHVERKLASLDINPLQKSALLGETLKLRLSAALLAGGPLKGGKISYFWTRESSVFSPPDHWVQQEYVFQTPEALPKETLSRGEVALDDEGTALLTQRTKGDGRKGSPYDYTLRVRLEGLPDGQQEEREFSSKLSPMPYYLGLKRQDRSAFTVGKQTEIPYIVLGLDGKLWEKTELLSFSVFRVEKKWTLQQGLYGKLHYEETEVRNLVSEGSLSSERGKGSLFFTPKEGGHHVIQLEGRGKKGLVARVEDEIWIPGLRAAVSEPFSSKLSLNLDKSSYAVGETAKIILESPLPKGKYLLTLERSEIFSYKILSLEKPVSFIEIPIKEEHFPVLYVSLSSFSHRTTPPPLKPNLPDFGKPKGLYGLISIPISKEEKRLEVSFVDLPSAVRPGQEVSLRLRITDKNGGVPKGELTLVGVDRGISDLGGSPGIPDPIDYFYRHSLHTFFPYLVKGGDTRASLTDAILYERKGLQGGGAKMTAAFAPDVRQDFRPLAIFRSDLITDEEGFVTVKATLPDSLSTYKLTAIASQGDRFGLKEADLLVKNPVNVKVYLPTSLRKRDTSEVLVGLDSFLSHQESFTVELASGDHVKLIKPKPQEVSVDSRETALLSFPIYGNSSGKESLRVTVASESFSEVVLKDLLVRETPLEEAFAISGEIPPAQKQNAPDDVEEGVILPQTPLAGGSLDLWLTSTLTGPLEGMASSFRREGEDRTAQKLAGFFPLLLLGEDTPQPSGWGKEDLKRFIEALANHQNSDGGFPFWLQQNVTSHLLSSASIFHYLVLGERNFGSAIWGKIDRNRLIAYLEKVLFDKENPQPYSLRSYVLYGLALGGEDVKDALARHVRMEKRALFGDRALAALTYAALKGETSNAAARKIFSDLKPLLQVEGRSVSLTQEVVSREKMGELSWGLSLSRPLVNLAFLYLLFQQLEPESPLIHPLISTLVSPGAALSVTDARWIFIALADRAREERATKTGGRLTLDSKELLASTGSLSETLNRRYRLQKTPLAEMAKGALLPLRITRQGVGSLFYAALLRYPLPQETIRARDEGYSLYARVLDEAGQSVQPEKLKKGEPYRYEITITTPRRRTDVLVTIPIPSGVKVMEGDKPFSLASEVVLPLFHPDQQWASSYYWNRSDKGEELFLGDKVVFRFPVMHPGITTVRIWIQGVFTGLYPTPPVRAESENTPEIFGRTKGLLYGVG